MATYEKDKLLERKMSLAYDDMYYRKFKGLVKIEQVTDLARQRQGIDKILTFANGKEIRVDEKTLDISLGNFVLEEYSKWEQKVLGWLEKEDSLTDYILYGYFKEQEIFIIPYVLLRAFYLRFKDGWLRTTKRDPNYKGRIGYFENSDKNKGYSTSGFYVPRKVVIYWLPIIFRQLYGRHPLPHERFWETPYITPQDVRQRLEQQWNRMTL